MQIFVWTIFLSGQKGLYHQIKFCRLLVVGLLQLSTSCLFVVEIIAAHLMGRILFVYRLGLDLNTSILSLFRSAGILL